MRPQKKPRYRTDEVLSAYIGKGKGFAGNASTAIPRSPALGGRVFAFHGSARALASVRRTGNKFLRREKIPQGAPTHALCAQLSTVQIFVSLGAAKRAGEAGLKGLQVA